MLGEFYINAKTTNCNFSTANFEALKNNSVDQTMKDSTQEYLQKDSSQFQKSEEKDADSDKHLQDLLTNCKAISSQANNFSRNTSSRHSTNPLKIWLQHHNRNPYPNRKEKSLLSQKTNMTVTQISTWFANARRRLKKENKVTWIPRNRSNCLDTNQLQRLAITKVALEAAQFGDNHNWTYRLPHTPDPYEVNFSQSCSHHKVPSLPEDNFLKSSNSMNMPSNNDFTASVNYFPEYQHQNSETQQYYISMETTKNPYLVEDKITSSSNHPCMISHSFIRSRSIDYTTMTSLGCSENYPPSCSYPQPRVSHQCYSNCVSYDSLPLTHDVHNGSLGIGRDFLRNNYLETTDCNGGAQYECYSPPSSYDEHAFHFNDSGQYTFLKHQDTFKADYCLPPTSTSADNS